METATELFNEFGYRAVGIRMIADKIGIQPSSLYYHFETKEDILYHIALRATKDFIEVHLPYLENTIDRSSALKTLIRRYIYYFEQNRLAQQVAGMDLRELEPDHLAEVEAYQRDFLHAVCDFVAQGVAEGTFHVTDHYVATRAFLDMLNHVFRWYRPEGGRVSLEDLADLYAEMIVGGMLRGDLDRSASSPPPKRKRVSS